MFDRTYAWTIIRSVDNTKITQDGGTATFNYTVTASHDAGTDSGWTLVAFVHIDNLNPRGDDVSGVTAGVSVDNGGNCTAPTGPLLVEGDDGATLAFTCTYSVQPSPSAGTLTATVSWPAQTLASGALLAAGSLTPTAASDFASAGPASIRRNDDCVSVTDNFNGTPATLGSPCVATDPNPTSFTYSHTVDVPASGCQSYPDTATFTTNTSGTTGSASQSVQACFFAPNPSIAITISPQTQTVASGGTADWQVTITNTGNVPLDVSVSSTNTRCDNSFASVRPNHAVAYHCVADVTSAFTEHVDVTGTPPSGPDVTASDSANVTVS